MTFMILQIKDIRNTDYAFRSWDEAKAHGFNISDYKTVYIGERESESILDDLWVEFNINRPDDFRGHSLSVSDIVIILSDDMEWYYCDSFGWANITEEINNILNE